MKAYLYLNRAILSLIKFSDYNIFALSVFYLQTVNGDEPITLGRDIVQYKACTDQRDQLERTSFPSTMVIIPWTLWAT